MSNKDIAIDHKIIVCGNDLFGYFVRQCRIGLGWVKLAGPYKYKANAVAFKEAALAELEGRDA